MARLLELSTFGSDTGNLTVFEKILPGPIKRVFFIYEAENSLRAGHRHYKAAHALVCLNGSCRVYINDGNTEQYYVLDNPRKCLIVEPKDWHTMDQFTKGAILLVLSNEYYDKADYIYEKYETVAV
ncbi:sugar 3,4-ketoisomerase [Larkinella soli]|uniref:sugar 3,4-ketoisomerase n=1 Tax=Larkinella soli TaxID=1770527 RepID=UPI000FFC9212|nr:FdtA/QdtA family cupin domain-containing protein [Larkinella soli]